MSPVNFPFWPPLYMVELTGTYPGMIPQIGKYLKDRYRSGDLFWSNNYRWYIYESSHVPSISPICKGKMNKAFQCPSPITNPEKIRWFIFFTHDARLPHTVDSAPCLGEKWQAKLEREYTKKVFKFTHTAYLINDPDIVNRSFPPGRVTNGQVVIYEKSP